jgi:uncharacterized membrane protein YhaH (DUF805 family)
VSSLLSFAMNALIVLLVILAMCAVTERQLEDTREQWWTPTAGIRG